MNTYTQEQLDAALQRADHDPDNVHLRALAEAYRRFVELESQWLKEARAQTGDNLSQAIARLVERAKLRETSDTMLAASEEIRRLRAERGTFNKRIAELESERDTLTQRIEELTTTSTAPSTPSEMFVVLASRAYINDYGDLEAHVEVLGVSESAGVANELEERGARLCRELRAFDGTIAFQALKGVRYDSQRARILPPAPKQETTNAERT